LSAEELANPKLVCETYLRDKFGPDSAYFQQLHSGAVFLIRGQVKAMLQTALGYTPRVASKLVDVLQAIFPLVPELSDTRAKTIQEQMLEATRES
jgi:hypothetical protein